MRPADDTHAQRAHAAGRLLQWGLRPRVRPAAAEEYAELVDRFRDDPAFAALVRQIAAGLGLDILDVSDHGLVLAPTPDSAFAVSPAAFGRSTSADDRLVEGLVEIAIAATVFPLGRDLDDDVDLARAPIAAADVEEQLGALCDRLAEQARSEPDPEASPAAQGLYEAWRVVRQRAAVARTADDRRASRSLARTIERALERLREHGCFTRAQDGERTVWQPTRRYHVLVQQLAAGELFAALRRAPAGAAGAADPDAGGS